MARIVYILGAGFSAPLEIPTIAQFLQKARDQQQADPKRFAYFRRIFASIKSLERANYYYSTNAESIEELLTLVEMTGELPRDTNLKLVKRFITDVIRFHTPRLTQDENNQHWDRLLMGGSPWTGYVAFVAALFGYRFSRRKPQKDGTPVFRDYALAKSSGRRSYGVITLNYDLVLETAAGYLARKYRRSLTRFTHSDGRGVPLIKLHGSIERNDLVPPLWNKRYEKVKKAWNQALEIISGANEIRLLGYSLPDADPYIRYLLRAAALRSENLKRVDVLCLDGDGRVSSRYDEFITFKGFRRRTDRKPAFVNGDVWPYLHGYQSHTTQWPDAIDLAELLESSHQRHFG